MKPNDKDHLYLVHALQADRTKVRGKAPDATLARAARHQRERVGRMIEGLQNGTLRLVKREAS